MIDINNRSPKTKSTRSVGPNRALVLLNQVPKRNCSLMTKISPKLKVWKKIRSKIEHNTNLKWVFVVCTVKNASLDGKENKLNFEFFLHHQVMFLCLSCNVIIVNKVVKQILSQRVIAL